MYVTLWNNFDIIDHDEKCNSLTSLAFIRKNSPTIQWEAKP